jgi:hypothetical protein
MNLPWGLFLFPEESQAAQYKANPSAVLSAKPFQSRGK